MNKEVKSNNKFIKIKYIIYDDQGYLRTIWDKSQFSYILIFGETYINPDFISEITAVTKDFYYTKNQDNTTSSKELSIFHVIMNNNKNFYLLEDEYKKFKDIIDIIDE